MIFSGAWLPCLWGDDVIRAIIYCMHYVVHYIIMTHYIDGECISGGTKTI